MSGSPAPIAIPEAVLAEIYEHAREAFPAECCGWLAGARDAAAVDRARRGVAGFEGRERRRTAFSFARGRSR